MPLQVPATIIMFEKLFRNKKRKIFSRDHLQERSLHHSIRDGMAHSIMAGGAETYFAAFAIFLKATASQVAIISTLPTLIGSLTQLISVWLDKMAFRRKPVILAGATLQALVWLPLIFMALRPVDNAVNLLLILLTFYFATGQLIVPAWTSLMGDIVPERTRGRYFAHRTALVSITSFAALVAAGCILHLSADMEFTGAGYALVFFVAFIARLISAWHLNAMHEPAEHTVPVVSESLIHALHRVHALRFSLYFVLMQLATAIAAPFFVVYMLTVLKFTYLEFMLNTGMVVLFQFITLNWWGRISDVFGNRLILIVTGMSVPLIPLLWLVTDNFWYLLTVQVFAGLAWGGFNLSSGNLLYDLVPNRQRTRYVAYHNLFSALGIFLGGLAGAGLVHVVPDRTTWLGDPAHTSVLLNIFLISTAARYLVSLVFLTKIRELRRPRRTLSAKQFVFRLSRFNAFMGLWYEFVTTSDRFPERKKHHGLKQNHTAGGGSQG